MSANEKKVFSLEVIKEIEELTDNNCHDDARILCAEEMNDESMMEEYEFVKLNNDIFGYLKPEMNIKRHEIDDKMFAKLRNEYINGEDVYQAF